MRRAARQNSRTSQYENSRAPVGHSYQQHDRNHDADTRDIRSLLVGRTTEAANLLPRTS